MDATATKKMRDDLDENGQLPCDKAHGIADGLGISAKSIGDLATENGLKISRCQLGLFGYAAKKGMPGFRKVQKLDSVPAEAEAAVQKSADNGNIACADLWQIGASTNLSRNDMGNIAETLSLKVSPCQLGCF